MITTNSDSLMKRIEKKKMIFKMVQKDPQQPHFYNRKDKSLEELSRRFLRQMIHFDSKFIYLDHLTHQLDVERRRLYDIINILESLKVVTRQCKNKYCWNGFKTIYQTIHELKQDSEVDSKFRSGRKEKSLEVLSVGFLKLFNNQQTWTLEEAAKRLSPLGTEEAKLKTTIRRLYDIANVLKSIGLISKCHTDKKAGYEWVGEPGLDSFQIEITKIPLQEEYYEGCQSTKQQKKDDSPLQSKMNMSGFYNFVMNVVLKHQINDMASTCTTVDKSNQENINPLQMFTPKIRPTLTIIYPPPSNLTPRKTITMQTIKGVI